MSRTTTRWAPWTSTVLCLAGLGVSTYLTIEHFSATPTYACPANATVNCIKVTTSSYSYLLGIPVALLGLLFFVGMTPLCLPFAWRSANPWLPRLRLAGFSVGVVFVVYLVWAELFPIGAICLWCTAVHAVTLALFAVVVLDAALRPIEDDPDADSDLPPRHARRVANEGR
jgi:uncharacterized membrane protein